MTLYKACIGDKYTTRVVPIHIFPIILSSSIIIVRALYTAHVPVIKIKAFKIESTKYFFNSKIR